MFYNFRSSIFTFLIALILCVGVVSMGGIASAQAPEGDPVPIGTDEPITIQVDNANDLYLLIALALLVVGIAGAQYYQHQTGQQLAKSIPPEIAQFMQGVTVVALGIAQTMAAKTASPTDDALLKQLADQLGIALPKADFNLPKKE